MMHISEIPSQVIKIAKNAEFVDCQGSSEQRGRTECLGPHVFGMNGYKPGRERS
jgi:hypothetical protein